MRHYLVDTNVIIDMLLNRADADAAVAVIRGAEREKQLRKVLHVTNVDSIVIDRALNSGWRDFEDAVQNFSAEANPLITGIITRNQKDFRHSELKIVDSRLFLK